MTYDITSATMDALQRTYAKPLAIPQRVPDETSWHIYFGYARYRCSVCSCTWEDDQSANPRTEWCEEDRLGCPCHSTVWWAVLI